MNGSLLALGAAGALALGAVAFPRGSRDLQAARTLSGTHLSRARITAWDPDHAKMARDAGHGFTQAYRTPLLGHGLYAFLDGHAPPGGPPGNPGDWVANPVTVTGRVLDLTQRVSPEEANAWIAWHLAQRTERMSPLRHLYGGVKVKNREPVEGEALFWSLKGHLGIRWTEEMAALGYAAVLFPCNAHGNFSETSRANTFVSFFVGDPSLVSWDPAKPAGAANRAAPQTAAFRRWFGDSKVVDADGKPRVVYHGGLMVQRPNAYERKVIEVFQGTRYPFSFPACSGGMFVGVGSFFSESADVAASYPVGDVGHAGRFVGAPPYGPDSQTTHARTLYPVYLSITRPKVYTTVRKAADDMLARAGKDPVGFVRLLQAEGYDGITYLEGPGYAPKTNKARVWVVFESTQVKSASANSGAFDPKDPRINANRTGGSRSVDPVTTPAFKAWFGKSVVRADRKPLVVYHGTRAAFDAFNDEPFGLHVGTLEAAATRLFHRGASHPEEREIPRRFLALYARIERPIRLKDPSKWEPFKVYKALWRGPLKTRSDIPVPPMFAYPEWPQDASKKDLARHKAIVHAIDRTYLAQLVLYLEGLGYDGVVYRNLHEDPGSTSYIAFRPTQVKAVDAVAFDRADPRISANWTGRKAKPAARGPSDPVPTMVLPAGTLLYHGTAHPRRFEQDGSSVFTSPFWVSRDPRVARMIALDDADEDDRPPRIFHLRTTRDIGPLAVLKTDADIADLVADVRDEPRERVKPGSLGSYQLARVLASESHPGWIAPGNYGSSRSVFSYGEAPVCRPSKPTCDDICLCLSKDVASLDLFRVEIVPAVEVQARRGHLR